MNNKKDADDEIGVLFSFSVVLAAGFSAGSDNFKEAAPRRVLRLLGELR
ncbi:MAG: hypothetical protein IKH27_12670 [Oscillospiraceae bacterium]|nr:hypothetical protein [Oscillospiraceae bacterium]